MNLWGQNRQCYRMAVFAALCVLILPAWTARAAVEDVEIVEDKPDETNPLYHIVKTKDGHIFRVPKDMPIQRKDGLTLPMNSEEYFLNKFEDLKNEMEVINERLDALEEIVKDAKDAQEDTLKSKEVGKEDLQD